MNKHLKYAKYVIRHKWWVFVECLRYGLVWQGLIHDFSKFLPIEWKPYADYFYGNYPSIKDVSGDGRNFFSRYKEDVKKDFDVAWLHHQKMNKHHWQWWVLVADSGQIKALPMPDKYRKEMLADWRGAGRAITGTDDTKNWYLKNGSNMMLHPETREWVHKELGLTGISTAN